LATTKFVWDELSDNVLMETDENNIPTAVYTHWPERFGQLISQERSGVTSYYHYDGEHSTRLLTDDSGAITDTYIYSAYGELVARTGTTNNPFGYKGAVGYYTNSATGDIYVRARTYEPVIGRWLSMDPLGFVDGPNLYQAYFVPQGIDPRGLCIRVGTTKNGRPIIKVTHSSCHPGFAVGDCFIYHADGKKEKTPCPPEDPTTPTVPPISICDGYKQFFGSTCNYCNKPIIDCYPEKAKRICDRFIDIYEETDLSSTVQGVAICLVRQEERCQGYKDCRRRNACRLNAHIYCYATNGFVPVLGLPEGGAEVGWEGLLPDWLDYYQEYFDNTCPGNI